MLKRAHQSLDYAADAGAGQWLWRKRVPRKTPERAAWAMPAEGTESKKQYSPLIYADER
jgi:hypothetical protein